MIFQIDLLGCVHGSSSFLNKKSFITYLAGPFASFIMELPGSHHHWLVNHLPSFLLRELFILLLWWWGPGRRDLTLRQRWFGRSKLICQLRKNYQVVSKALGTTPHQNSLLSFKKHPQESHPHSLHLRPSNTDHKDHLCQSQQKHIFFLFSPQKVSTYCFGHIPGRHAQPYWAKDPQRRSKFWS